MQTVTAQAMQPASPDRNPAIRLGAWTPKSQRFRKSRKHSPEAGAIGTPNDHDLMDTLHLLDTLHGQLLHDKLLQVGSTVTNGGDCAM